MPLGGARPDVVGFGEPLVLCQPPQDHHLITTDMLEVHVAGAELNAAAAVATLGGSSALCTRLGDDPFGGRVRAVAARLGVALAAETDRARPTGVYFKDVQPDGARRVYYYRSTSAASAMGVADADRGLALRPRAVLVSGLTAALGTGPADAVRHVGLRAAEHGCALVVDVNLRPQLGRLDQVHQVLREVLPRTDLLIVGTDESMQLLGTDTPADIVDAAFAAGCREVVVKTGADGSWWVDPAGVPHHQPSLAGAVVDPVGAGDAFTGGYVAARLAGAAPGAAARLASELAGRVIAATGDTAGLPGQATGRRLLANAVTPATPAE